MKHHLLLAAALFMLHLSPMTHAHESPTQNHMKQLAQQSDHVVLGTVAEIQTEHTFNDTELLGRRHVVEVSVLIEANLTLKTTKREPLGLIRVPITHLSEKQWQTMKPGFYKHFMGHQHVVFLKGDDLKPTTNYSFMQHPDALLDVQVAIDEATMTFNESSSG